jgi:hypothetical protein
LVGVDVECDAGRVGGGLVGGAAGFQRLGQVYFGAVVGESAGLGGRGLQIVDDALLQERFLVQVGEQVRAESNTPSLRASR